MSFRLLLEWRQAGFGVAFRRLATKLEAIPGNNTTSYSNLAELLSYRPVCIVHIGG